ncbi:hypothetical protein [Pelosinus sp. IPA-1]|uniref:hypothetical protein n=1 Tax=Pelosinus sp. IPA-1 TaxID=3029569 RepID=UPI0024362413|nr:hypothetical protein [Pelosinus sp. IPA-1]GMB00454.1 hypothetical protein PIPA1_32530 [Pelosinus sp. IPA-1]
MIDKKYIIVSVAVIIAFLAGLFAGVKYLAPALTTTNSVSNTVEKQPIYITGQTVKETELQYVKGETVYLPAPASNTELVTPVNKDTPGAVATKLDGKFNIGKPDFVYQVNGKVGKFTKTDDEQYIFDKGMLDLKQTSTIKIQAEIPTIDLTRHNVMTVGAMFTKGKIEPGAGYTGSMSKVGAYQLAGSQSAAYVGAGFKF